jgi:hypothetical protein
VAEREDAALTDSEQVDGIVAAALPDRVDEGVEVAVDVVA